MWMRRKLQFSLVLVAALGCLATMGCGGGSGKQTPLYKVYGKVTLLGGPLVGAVVSFAPQDGQPTAVGMTDEQGKYALTTRTAGDGAAAGEYAVVITKSLGGAPAPEMAHGTDPAASYGSGSHDQAKKSASKETGVLSQYSDAKSTPLRATVKKEGVNEHNFELK